jgi:hypothetical protein
VVLWRETWRGRTYMSCPVRVVEDSDERLAIYVAEGTPFRFDPAGWPWEEEHPWAKRGRWQGEGILVVHPPGAAHTVWHFWAGPERRFAGWYVNLQQPLVRDGSAFDTQDHELDIWIERNGSWRWKDIACANSRGPQRAPSRARDLKAQGPPAGAVWSWKDEATLEAWVEKGRFTEAEARAIRAEGERVLAAWPFPTGWEDWTPDPSWPVPAFVE